MLSIVTIVPVANGCASVFAYPAEEDFCSQGVEAMLKLKA